MTNHDEKYQVLLTVTVPSEKWCLVKDTHTLLQDIMPTNSPFFDKKNPQKTTKNTFIDKKKLNTLLTTKAISLFNLTFTFG